LKGVIRRAFRDGFDVNISRIFSHSRHFFSPDSIFLSPYNIFRYIALSVLVRKLANTSGRILVNSIKIIISGTCDNSGFHDNKTNMKIAVVSELTA
jgi:hypothetical protein